MIGRKHTTLMSVLGLVGLCGATSEAMASGFALREQSAEGLGNAFAGQTAKDYNASAAFYNPAGLTRLNQDEAAGTVTWIAPVSKFSGTASAARGTNGGDAIKDAAVGSLFGVINLNSDWKIGLSVATPYGMRVEYKEDWVGRYQALASDVTDIEFSPTIAYRVDDHLSLGAGPRIDYMAARLTQAVNFGGIARLATGGANPFNWGDGLAKVEGNDIGVGYTLSGLYEFDKDTRAALTYKSRVHHELEGKVSYQTPNFAGAGALGAALGSRFINRDVTAKITTPDSLNFGLYRDINEQWAVMSDVSWTNWSVFKTLNVTDNAGTGVSNVEERWKDTMFVSLGANYKPTDKLTLHTGVAFDQSAVDDQHRTARIPDSNRYWTSFGASYALAPSADIHFGYTHIFADKATIDEGSAAGSAGGRLTGTYSSHVDIVSASFAVKF